MTGDVIDFKTRKRLEPSATAPRRAPDENRKPKFIVEFFDDDYFPVRFKGVETDASFLRDAANGMKQALMGLLEIAYEKDPDPSQRIRMIAYLFQDGGTFCDVYNPDGTDDERVAYDWMIAAVPTIAKTLRVMKERECTPTG